MSANRGYQNKTERRNPGIVRRAAPAVAIAVVAVGVVARFDAGAASLVSSKTPGSGTSSGNTASGSTASSTCGKKATGDIVTVYEGGGGFGGRTFGQVAVTAWVNNGKVCKVSSSYQAYDGRSQMIDQQVMPMLDQEAVQVGNANITLISGATYTSQAYAQSLQAAISKA